MTAPTDQSPTSDPAPAQPVLSYATPEADGLPEWHPEAEALIDQRAPLRRLRGCFVKSEDAVRYFAKSMEQRYSPQNAGTTCIACGGPAREWWVVCIWTATGHYRTLTFHLGSEPTAQFRTCHAICDACRRRWLTRPWLNGFLRVCRWSGWLAVAAFAVIILSDFLPQNLNMPLILGSLGLIAASYLLQFAGRIIFGFLKPRAMRKLVPRRRVSLTEAAPWPQNPGEPPYGPPFGPNTAPSNTAPAGPG